MRFIILLTLGLFFFRGEVYGQFPPPKIEPKEIDQLSQSEIPTVSYCELLRNPKLYNQKFIRLRSVYAEVGGEYENLYDLSCYENPSREATYEIETQTWAWFDESYKSQTKPEVLKVFEQLRDFGHRADVIVVGKFYGSDKHGGYGHLNSARFMFVIVRIEQVMPIKSNAH